MITNPISGKRPQLAIVMPHHWALATGGAEYQAQQLAEQLLRRAEYEVIVVARAAPPKSLWNGIDVIGIADSPDRPRPGYIADALPLYRALKRINPDVIYQRVGCGYTAIAAHYARRNRIPMIWHVSHDTDVSPAPLGRSTNFVTRTLEKRCVEFGLHNAHLIICQTNEQARLLAHHYGRRADMVVPNFHPSPVETLDKAEPVTVLWIANLKRFKQPEVFLRLAARLRNLREVRFVMVGELGRGLRCDREWRERVLEGLSEASNVEFLGPRSQAEVNALLARSHLLVNTSLQEGFPNTFIQAWMRAVPVASLQVNPDGVLERESVGICAGSEDELANAIRSLLQDKSRLESYGETARRYALAQHSLRNVQQIEQLIAASLATRPYAVLSDRTR